MIRNRVIPCLLLQDRALVKTVNFRNPSYVGDPINTVRIFNEMEVDELIFLDIEATRVKRPPSLDIISEIACECFMPFAYGGGLTSIDSMKRVYQLGAEKVSLNTIAYHDPELVNRAADLFGSQSIIISMDVKRNLFGKYAVCIEGGKVNTGIDPVAYSVEMAKRGAGEVLLNSIDRDGTFKGFDTALIRSVSREIDIPVIACGGAGSVADFAPAIKEAGASAVAIGSMVVYQNKNRSVLINYPSRSELQKVLN